MKLRHHKFSDIFELRETEGGCSLIISGLVYPLNVAYDDQKSKMEANWASYQKYEPHFTPQTK